MITREQQRMQLAWEVLSQRHGEDSGRWKDKGKPVSDYLGALKKTPARIQSCGLGMALAFLHSRSQEAAKHAASDIEKATLKALGRGGQGSLLREIRTSDAAFLFLATDEAVALIAWMTRLLEGAGVESHDTES